MKVLIIGGTKFLGRHLVDSALSGDHEVALFNRGNLVAEVPGTESIHGDRHRDLDRLAGSTWNAVIDTCGFLPQSVTLSARALADSVSTYVFISSISAYASFEDTGITEDRPTARLTAEQSARFESFDLGGEINAVALGEAYGGLKAACERAITSIMPGRLLTVRSGLLVGPFDPTDRFTYWVMRTAEGGEVLTPGKPERRVQFIDVRDLADWTVKALENEVTGTFNVTGLPEALTMSDTLNAIKAVAGSDANFTWVDEQFIESEGVQPWGELPVYLPESDGDSRGFLSINVDRALETGLVFRPLIETVGETLEWRRKDPTEMRAGLSREREKQLLQRWSEQTP